jgi:uncharacterized membrane protein SpoIIM required for sporulation
MRETAFLKQNEKKWKEFELVLHARKGTVPPDKIAELFVEVTDDLAYARTHYPQSNTTQYLNGLASQLHQVIVRNKKVRSNSVFSFYRYELPLIMAESQRKLLLAFTVFAVAILIGVVSTQYDSNFLGQIVGEDYQKMTENNMAKGTPLAVYGGDSEVGSFLYITVNNILVSFLAFVSGIVLSAGTVYHLFKNGVMVGAFFTFLFQGGFGQEAILTVMIHGTLELSAIVIAGAAGFTLGNSILFPGTYSRVESLKQGALRGIKIIAGLIPVFIVAGFLEGFVTRHTEMPAVVSLLIILSSWAFIIFYFIVYPLQLKGMGYDLKKIQNGEFTKA